MLAAAPVLPVRYVVNASRIADRRMILAGYQLADLLNRVVGSEVFPKSPFAWCYTLHRLLSHRI